jgi:putative addiction module component (TIGR02574 family)
MDPTTTFEAVRAWPLDDQIEFAFRIWDHIVDAGWKPELTDELKEVLDRRLAAYEADPKNVYTWDEVLEHVRRPR